MDPSKAERMRHMLLKKKKCDKIAMDIVTHLIEPNVEKEYLLQRAGQIHPSQWDDIVEERKIIGICGWVLCNERLQTPPKQQYVIRIKKKQVLDITERKNYCSSFCYGASQHFKRQIPESPLWLRDEEPEPSFNLADEASKTKVSLDGIEVRLTELDLGSSSSSSSDDDSETETRPDISSSKHEC